MRAPVKCLAEILFTPEQPPLWSRQAEQAEYVRLLGFGSGAGPSNPQHQPICTKYAGLFICSLTGACPSILLGCLDKSKSAPVKNEFGLPPKRRRRSRNRCCENPEAAASFQSPDF